MNIIQARSREHLDTVRALFKEYADALDIDLCFQNFDQELAGLPGKYALPEGRLLLAVERDEAAGCVGLRNIGDNVCEMKRLYVRPAFRKKGLGRALAVEIISAARQIGYDRMRLDTLSSMSAAIALYESLGFQRVAPYYHNPSDRAVFMEFRLHQNFSRQAQ